MAIPSQLDISNWKPFKGSNIPQAPAIGRAPQGDNPRFPTVGPSGLTPPPGGYQSVISTAPPLDQGQQNRVARTTAPSLPFGSTNGKMSLSAFGRALTDNTNSSMRSGMADYEQQYVNQAQKSLAEDLLSQKHSAADRYKMNSANAVYGADTQTHYDTGVKDLQQNFMTQKWNEQTERAAAVIRFFSRLF